MRPPHSPSKAVAFLHRAEELGLALLLTVMILLACLQIILRTFFNSGLPWIDPLLRYLVLWCGLLGAVAATGQGKHITLDLFSKYLSLRSQRLLGAITDLFAALVAGLLAWASFRFIAEEFEYNSERLLAVPIWIWNGIFLLSFVLMGCRFLFSALGKGGKLAQQSESRNT